MLTNYGSTAKNNLVAITTSSCTILFQGERLEGANKDMYANALSHCIFCQETVLPCYVIGLYSQTTHMPFSAVQTSPKLEPIAGVCFFHHVTL